MYPNKDTDGPFLYFISSMESLNVNTSGGMLVNFVSSDEAARLLWQYFLPSLIALVLLLLLLLLLSLF